MPGQAWRIGEQPPLGGMRAFLNAERLGDFLARGGGIRVLPADPPSEPARPDCAGHGGAVYLPNARYFIGAS